MKTALAGVLCAAGFAASATAATTWTTQIRFSVTRPDGQTLLMSGGNTLAGNAGGVYTITVQVGIFNLTGQDLGQSNQGLFNWTGRVSMVGFAPGDTLAVDSATSRVAPFNSGPSTEYGGTLVGTNVIEGNAATPGSFVQSFRDIVGGASAPWPDASPQPTTPIPGSLGANSFTNVFRFHANLVQENQFVQFSVTGSAGPILGWLPSSATPPDPESGADGSVNFLGITRSDLQGGAVQPYTTTGFGLIMGIFPAPGSGILLGFAGLFAARRRR
ncbi:MAG: hypothetical protein KF745_04915 [Phycisphaeraceae bacterium]|nr:hypothetical protein [Phycisphaeraceae bacterium]